MNYDMIHSGKRIQQLRMEEGYTQDELAATLNINRSYLSRIESGKKGCSVDVFIQLSEIFHVSLDFLILGKLDVTQKLECKEQLKAEIVSLIDHLTKLQTHL